MTGLLGLMLWQQSCIQYTAPEDMRQQIRTENFVGDTTYNDHVEWGVYHRGNYNGTPYDSLAVLGSDDVEIRTIFERDAQDFRILVLAASNIRHLRPGDTIAGWATPHYGQRTPPHGTIKYEWIEGDSRSNVSGDAAITDIDVNFKVNQ